MADMNLPNDIHSLFGLWATQGLEPKESTAPGAVKPVEPTDSVSQAIESQNKLSPGTVQLDPSLKTIVDPETFYFNVTGIQQRVVSFITEQMAKTAQEMAESLREDQRREIRLGLERLFSESALHTSREAGDVEGRHFATLTLSSITAMMMMSAVVLGQVVTPAAQIEQTELHGLHPTIIDSIPANLQQMAITAAGVVSIALYAPVFRSVMSESMASKGGLPDTAFGNAYANQVIGMIANGEMNRFFETIFGEKIAGMSPQAKGLLFAQLELSYLFGALSVLYRKETGWVTEEELYDMLSQGPLYNKIAEQNPEDPRLGIVDMMRERLALLSEAERAAFLQEALVYYSDNPEADRMNEAFELVNRFYWMDLNDESNLNKPV